jgi:3-phosphoshikimate 1-carboxyvinyltransferase
MLAALAPGTSRLRGALTALDARSTARTLRALGAGISALRHGADITVEGQLRFAAPARPLDCGNSGTTARLLLGLLAAHPFEATVTGDRSLRDRPMARIAEPLRHMGATVAEPGQTLPLQIHGGRLRPSQWALPVASAQIKSAILLAGMAGEVAVMLTEPGPSRDHTERLLRRFGYIVEAGEGVIHFAPTGQLEPFELDVPGDASSAAFVVAAALLGAIPDLAISGVGLNPGRTGWLAVLDRMGVAVATEGRDEVGGEPVGTLIARPGVMRATDIPAEDVPSLIDEIPILACLAARAEGTSRFSGLAELRVKESDRLDLLARNLTGLGAAAVIEGDDLVITGADRPLKGKVETAGDHRIAMAFQVLGLAPRCRITVDDPACADVSFPGFGGVLDDMAARRP